MDKTKQIIAFVTSSEDKEKEMQNIMRNISEKYEIQRTGDRIKLREPQEIKSLEEFVKDKTLQAFKKLKTPVIIEHTMLDIAYFGGLPCHMTNEFSKKITNYEVCRKMEGENHRHATARTFIGFCDGKKINVFKGEVHGKIAEFPKGKNGFGWDEIFIPNEKNTKNRTYAEMTSEEKDKISMRKRALDELRAYLQNNGINFYKKENEDEIEKLKEKIKNKQLILFIGAGVPKNLKLPTWGQLIEDLGESLGYDKDVFMSLSDDYLALAEFVRNEDEEKLLKGMKDKFLANEAEGTIAKKDYREAIFNSPVYRGIVELKPKKIYTTNYDETLEKAFEIFRPGKNKNSVVKRRGDSNLEIKTSADIEIVKIHGGITSLKNKTKSFDKSIVLTEESYFDAMSEIEKKETLYRNFKMDIDDKNNIFIFMGYGLADWNIRYFMNKNGKNKLDDERFYMFTSTKNPIQEQILNLRGIKSIYGRHSEPGKALELFLYDLNIGEKYLMKNKENKEVDEKENEEKIESRQEIETKNIDEEISEN